CDCVRHSFPTRRSSDLASGSGLAGRSFQPFGDAETPALESSREAGWWRPEDRRLSPDAHRRGPKRPGQPPKLESDGREMSGFSSSSTLTSLNVMTRTFLTKRAGRYMSQRSEEHTSELQSR